MGHLLPGLNFSLDTLTSGHSGGNWAGHVIEDVSESLHNDTVRCTSHKDCPPYSVCSQGNVTMQYVCVCISSVEPAIKNKHCPESILAPPGSTGVLGGIAFPESNFGSNLGWEQQDQVLMNTSQTTHRIINNGHMSDDPLEAALKIFVPLASLLVLGIFVTVIVLRYWSLCQRRQKQRKGGAIVKASEDIQLLDRMDVVNKNPSYFQAHTQGGNKRANIVDIPTESIKLMEVVGEGAFGQVFKGELLSTDGDQTKGVKKVAVKVLKEGVSNEAREDFEREVDIMSTFDHDNILRLLGIVSRNGGDTPYMVFEYMLYGDLAELLRKNDPSIRDTAAAVILQKINLIDITTQIANGMKYLTSQRFVHRDLATRNCLVGEGLVVKISDFGMSRDIYTCDYYRIGGSRMLPVRWMSPEAVKWGRFTTESDIWAFGVVLWEIFNYGRQPYYGHTNEEVIRFLDEGILLQRPDECPSLVYHVILQCWKLDPKERLPFDRIYKYLVEYSKQLSRNQHNASLDVINEYEIPL